MRHDHAAYTACLPEPFRSRAGTQPVATWWPWRDHAVHVARARNPAAPARLMILHGAGGHAGAVWPMAALAADIGFEVLAPDLPGYGRTRTADPGAIRYPDWIDCVCDLIAAEREKDARPLVVLGASMGGMLAYSAAAKAPGVARLLVTCLLDPRDDWVWSALSPWAGRWGLTLLNALAPVTDALRVPIRWLTPMAKIANQPALSRLCRTDPRGGGGRVALGFLRTYLASSPPCEPETFTAIPVTLIHPAADRWTPPELSLRFFNRLAAPKRYVPLDNAGHFPVERPGVDQLHAALAELFAELGSGATATSRAGHGAG